MGHEHTPPTVEAFSRCHDRRTQRSTRLCVRRGDYPGHGLLSARKFFLQRLDALCEERRLCPGSRPCYAPDTYHDFIGFGVSVPLLEQPFRETYGLDLKTVLTNEDEVLGSYRHAVSQLLPKATRIAWSLKKDEILKDQPSMTKRKFLYNLSRASYQKNWGKTYRPPSFWERFLGFLTRILPKIGPLKVLQLKTPTPAAEKLFQASFNSTLDRYRQLLTQVGAGQLDLPNENFDTGAITGPGKYRLNDETHAQLLDALAKESFSGASPEVRS